MRRFAGALVATLAVVGALVGWSSRAGRARAADSLPERLRLSRDCGGHQLGDLHRRRGAAGIIAR